MGPSKLIIIGVFLFAVVCLTAFKAEQSTNSTKKRLMKNFEEKLSTSVQSSFELNSDLKKVPPMLTEETSSKANIEVLGIQIKEETATSNSTEKEIVITTDNSVPRPQLRPSAFFANSCSCQAALVIPKTLELTPKSNVSTTENTTIATTPDPQNGTAPKVLAPEEKYHPIISEFVSRVRRIDAGLSTANEASSSVNPEDISYYNPRVLDYPKLKYFKKFLHKFSNTSTGIKIGMRDSSFIRAYYAKKNYPTAIDYSKEADTPLSKLNPENNEPPKRLPFNTKDYYSPKYEQFTKFNYDFFPRYINGKLVVPIHA